MKVTPKRRTTPSTRSSIPWLWVGVGIIALAILAVFLYSAFATRPKPIEGIQVFTNLSQEHTTSPVNYPQVPPVGGAHAPVWQNCGIYDQPIPNEPAVHSLEHGAVWLTYRPDLPADQVEQLKNLARGQRFVLLSPYDGLPAPVVASAWGLQLKVESAGDPRLAEFVRTYQKGPQTPEPGAPCSGGVGVPTG